MAAPAKSLLDPGQAIVRGFDDQTGRFRVDAQLTSTVAGPVEVIIDQTTDSIKIGDGTNLVSTTTVGTDVGLDVNIVGGVVTGNFTSSGLSTNIKPTSVIVTDVPTKVPGTALLNRNSMSVRVFGTATVFFGDSTVSVSNGYPKYFKEEIILDIKDNSNINLWAVCDAGTTCELRVLELA